MLGVLTIDTPVTNFIQYICTKNNENWLRVDKVIATKKGGSSSAHPVCITNDNSHRISGAPRRRELIKA